MADVTGQIDSGNLVLGEIVDHENLASNLVENAIPGNIGTVTVANYPEFLRARRQMMAAVIRGHFEQL